MKKLMYVLFAALMMSLVACHNQPVTPPEPNDPEIDDPTIPSNMQLFVEGIGEITGDTTIIVTTAEEQLSGKLQMSVEGTLEGVQAVRVIVTRSELDREDELCALGTCAAGDGQLEQEFNFRVVGDNNKWYAHYTFLPDFCTTEPYTPHYLYTVNYKFINYSCVVTLTVVYDFKNTVVY